MPEFATILLVALKTTILICGSVMTWLIYKAYRRRGMTRLQPFWMGFAFITSGALLTGNLDWLLPLSATERAIIPNFFTAGGLVLLLYSLYFENPVG
ncbi:DUF7521 family protein [Halobacterium hubeiense]|uniref:DUF7521 family protein n=1 Tax=Halobacterium hubeiense TaxID=1407499 RepID=UPI000B7DDC23|nr:hypothetical protein [Halobacterium hubeiense]